MKTPMDELRDELFNDWERKPLRYQIDVLIKFADKEKEFINKAYKQGSDDRKSSKFIIDYYESIKLTPNEN